MEKITVAIDDSPPQDLQLKYWDLEPFGIQAFRADIVAPKDTKKLEIHISYKVESGPAYDTMLADMRKLLESEEDADFLLSFADGILKAHSVLLKTRVPFFR